MRHGHEHGHGRHGFHFGRRGGWGGPGGPNFTMGFGMGVPGWDDGDPRRGGRRRMFDGNELRLILLQLISEQPRHGYDLIREIEERSGGAYAPSPGVVYPTLTMLDEMGLIEEQKAEGAKKQFAITEAGTAHLAENAEQAAALMGRLTDMGAARAKGDRAPIKRAVGNLMAVLANRFFHGEMDDEMLHNVAAILDEAAQKIERL